MKRSRGHESIIERSNRQQENAAALFDCKQIEMANRLIRCAQENELRISSRDGPCYKPINRCNSRYCEFCSWRESKKARKRYSERVLNMANLGCKLAMLTLTVPNTYCVDSQDYDRLFDYYKTFLQEPLIKTKILGSLARIETTFNPDRGEFHPHIHAMIVYSGCIPQPEMKTTWARITEDDMSHIELSDVPGSGESSRSVWIESLDIESENPKKTITRAVNYILKFQPICDPDAFASYYGAAKGKHLHRAFGAMRGALHKHEGMLRHYLDIRGEKYL